MAQLFMAIAAILGGTSVALGAFASHGLKDRLTERSLDIFEIATRYQMYHALALLLVSLFLLRMAPSGWLTAAGFAFMAGVVLFSGSLYTLSLTNLNVLGAVAPLGGFAFMVGWGCVAIAAFSLKP